MKQIRGTKRERRHRKNCAAVGMVERGLWPTPWWLTGERSHALGWSWLRVGCNDTECLAGFWINEWVAVVPL